MNVMILQAKWPYFFITLLLLLFGRLNSKAQNLSKEDISRICIEAKAKIDSHYVIKEKRSRIQSYLDSHLKAGSYFLYSNPDSLAARLTSDLRKVSNDKHLYVQYLKGGGQEQSFDWDAWAKQERMEEVEKNFGFTDLSILPGNIGYMRIVECMNPDRGIKAATSALLFLENTKGLIIDLRGNGGGYGGLQDLILTSYFEEEPVHISTFTSSNAPPNKTYTLPFTVGKRRIGTPLYILTDKKTGSAAEFFAYTLQTFKKAIIIGEPSAGAAHMNSYYPIGKDFCISISTGAPINPITNTNWEGTGILPDVPCSPEQAKEKAWLKMKEALDKAEKINK